MSSAPCFTRVSDPITRFLVGRREGGKRLDHFLHERVPGLSRTRWQAVIRQRVTVSWLPAVRAATPVRAGGEVHIGWTPLAERPLDLTLPILARGEGWLAVDKPSGIPVHPVNRIRENSLIRLLRRQEACEELRLAHRLDRETSGVLLVARDSRVAASLGRAFRDGQVHKEYVAVVAGEMAEDRGQIDLPIGAARDSRVFVRREAGHGEAARTDWSVERRLEGATVVRVFPRTGRRHQLRVHLAALGHPILGDLLYGRADQAYLDLVHEGIDARSTEPGPGRQLLHCARVAIEARPGRPGLDVRAPWPADLAAWAECGKGTAT